MSIVLLLHYDEIGLKGRNRPFFERRLCRAAEEALSSFCTARCHPTFGRLILQVDGAEAALWPLVRRVLPHVFGVAHFELVRETPADLAAMRDEALAMLPSGGTRTFGVRAHRADKSFPCRSYDIAAYLGAAIQTDRGWAVNLGAPEVELFVTTFGGRAFLSTERVPGAGGLPAGTSVQVVCLLSGGIDSPVAAYRLMRRGALPVFVHFHSHPYTDARSQETARRLAETVLRGQAPRPFWLVPLGEIQQRIIGDTAPDFRVLLYRRFMLRIAARLATREGAQALVTGEVLGQVASQTMENMTAVAAAVDLPVLRPLIGYDKREIVALAQALGTYDLSIGGGADCCSYLVPAHPATRAQPAELAAQEALVPVEALVDDAVAHAERAVLRGRFGDPALDGT
jgi:thiamine biosynthesis protein ThiI